MRFLRSILVLMIATTFLCQPLAAHAETQKKKWSGWQCVTYARQISPIKIFGNAWTWWQQAASKYERGHNPKVGSVLVFQKSPFMHVGHVAVVREQLNDREIVVEHANWAPIGGQRGQVDADAKMMDVSPNNDWTQVRVWYGPASTYGRVNQTYGFIYSTKSEFQNSGDFDSDVEINWNNNG